MTRCTAGPLAPIELDAWLDDLAQSQDHHGFTQWPVIRHDGATLGLCGLMIDDDEDSPCLGGHMLSFAFAVEYHGFGYAREAALGSLGYAFDKLGVHRVIARTTRDNRPSWLLMQAIGMKPDHRLDYRPRIGEERIVYVMSWRGWRDFQEGYLHQRFFLAGPGENTSPEE